MTRVLEGAAFDDLRPGQVVRFEEGDGRHGPRARRVVVD
jgi:cold shock CspA family protein